MSNTVFGVFKMVPAFREGSNRWNASEEFMSVFSTEEKANDYILKTFFKSIFTEDFEYEFSTNVEENDFVTNQFFPIIEDELDFMMRVHEFLFPNNLQGINRMILEDLEKYVEGMEVPSSLQENWDYSDYINEIFSNFVSEEYKKRYTDAENILVAIQNMLNTFNGEAFSEKRKVINEMLLEKFRETILNENPYIWSTELTLDKD